MRGFRTAVVVALGLLATSAPVVAADLRSDPRYSGPYDDGPPPVVGMYLDCGRPVAPYADNGYGPWPNSRYFGPLGYNCYQGVYAYEPIYRPFYPPPRRYR
jgi:hypothetical protein